MRIIQLPVLNDNYIFILIDEEKNEVAVIDPAVANVVIEFLEKNNLKLRKIFNTHHHGDHIGGNAKLKEKYPDLEVYGGAHDKGKIPFQTHFLNHLDTVTFAGEVATVYHIPGHTLGHVCYHFKNYLSNTSMNSECLFVGDTIFSGGCGKIFESTFSQMFESLKFLREQLSDKADIYCAHEYTVENYKVLLKLEPKNFRIKEKLEKSILMRQDNLFTVPFNFGEERQTSSFFRWDDLSLKQITQTNTDLETFTYVRKFRDQQV